MRGGENAFKAALHGGAPQFGLWVSLCSPASAEIAAVSGASWVLIDMEHAPNEVAGVADQMRAAEPYTSVVVRPPVAEPVVVKRLLDIGVQTLMLPMIETADEARKAVEWTRYPPEGTRGVSGIVRASRYGRDAGYRERAGTQTCVVMQAESPRAIDNIAAIAAVPGVDAIFIGPGDLAAAMGYPGNPNAEPVQTCIARALAAIRQTPAAAGVLAYGVPAAHRAVAAGAGFVAVGADTWLLANAAANLIAECEQSLAQ